MSSLRRSAEEREEQIRCAGENNIEDGVQLTIDDIVPPRDEEHSLEIAEAVTIIDEPSLEDPENNITVE
jgi:hypothetical protein